MTQYVKPHPPGKTDNTVLGFIVGDEWLDVSVQPADQYVLVNTSRVDGVWRKVSFTDGVSGVASLNALTGALTLVAGSNITITPSGTNITITSSGGGGGGSTNVPANALAFGDGLSTPGVTGDPNIAYTGTGFSLANGYNIGLDDTVGGVAGIGTSSDSMILYSTDTSQESVPAITIDLNTNSPNATFGLPIKASLITLNGSSATITWDDQDGRDPSYSAFVSGAWTIFSQQSAMNVMLVDFDGRISLFGPTGLQGLYASQGNLILDASGARVNISGTGNVTVTGILQASSDATYDIGTSGANRFNNLWLAGNISIDGGGITGLIEQIPGLIESPVAKTYFIILSNVVPLAINNITIQAVSGGTCTASLQINSTSITGLDSMAVSVTPQTITATGLNTMVAGDILSLVVTSPSSPQDMAFVIQTTRS